MYERFEDTKGLSESVKRGESTTVKHLKGQKGKQRSTKHYTEN